MRARWFLLSLLVACQSATPPDRTEKPQAAVDLRIDDRDLGGGDHELTLVATPTGDVVGLELALDGRRAVIGAARAGTPATLTVRATGNRDVVGTAWVGPPGHRRSKAAQVHLGPVAVAAPPRTTLVTMPDGTVVEEYK
jgi:hypothetical protein